MTKPGPKPTKTADTRKYSTSVSLTRLANQKLCELADKMDLTRSGFIGMLILFADEYRGEIARFINKVERMR